MENSTSPKSHPSSNSTKNNDRKTNNKPRINNADDDIEIWFGSLRFSSKNASTSAAAAPPSDSSEKYKETQVMKEEKMSPKSDHFLVTQEFDHGGTQWPSSSAVDRNIWAHENLEYQAYRQIQALKEEREAISQAIGHSCGTEEFGYGGTEWSSSSIPHMNITPCQNSYDGDFELPPHVNLAIDNLLDDSFEEIDNYTNKYQQDMDSESSRMAESQLQKQLFTMAINPSGSKQLLASFTRGDIQLRQDMMRRLLPFIFSLMTNPFGRKIFRNIIENCHIDYLHAILMKVQRESQNFLDTAFCELGSVSINMLLKRLKGTAMEFTITSIVSKRCYDLMTHRTGSYLIRNCFKYFGHQANQVLNDYLLCYFIPIATHPEGSITICGSINDSTGSQREHLLNLVANNAKELSFHPSGIFVVEHVLGLNNDAITTRICYCLSGHYMELAVLKSGNYLVQKCLSSQLGLSLVVEEMLKNDANLFLLAYDEFGNYAVQRALELTKLFARDLYEALVEALKPHYLNLLHKRRGRYVARLIKDDIERQRAH